MHVAKYWRNKKLRYRMIRAIEHNANGRAAEQNANGRAAAEAKTLGFARAIEKRHRRVRAVS